MQTLQTSSLTYWSEHIKHWQVSGLTQAAYCKRHELKDYTLGYWKRKLDKTEPPPLHTSAFSQVKIQQPPQGVAGLSLLLPSGLRIDGIAQDNLVIINDLIERLK